MYINKITQKSYLRQIQQKREEMIRLGNRFGLTNEKTIASSQELDELLNEYQHLFQQEKVSKLEPIVIKEMSFIIYKKNPKNNKIKTGNYKELNVI
ncbi:Spo0E family sporulation regulatory protein-aspartic acid phosphatase [Heyndrickxia sp. NPDC080065]|uniref:Spo0E family sporulation regulatory protein-aspartic acid phosphatase n=1 Tax=Heyndrickxia sp. NPDC080065 TaxID=3390568 RepID=UPI003D01708A